MYSRGLGFVITYVLFYNAIESNSHLFFECEYSMALVRNLLLNGSFFLFQVTLQQVLASTKNLEHKALKNLNCLITSVLVYKICMERNLRIHTKDGICVNGLAKQIRLVVALKLMR